MATRATRAERDNPAVRAEPRSIGSARADDPLSREIKLLGALLGQVIVEQQGIELLDLVEAMRRAAIGARRGHPAPGGLVELDTLPSGQLAGLARAFTLYFLLVNLAEEKHRLRILARRQRAASAAPAEESVAAAVAELTRRMGRRAVRDLIARVRITPVLTAHPTEARRRTVLIAQRRIYRLLDRLDDARLTPAEDADVRRRLREEITLLWQTSPIREDRPGPLDEVRAAMVFFDETLFTVTPRLYRTVGTALERASSAAETGGDGSRPPRAPGFVRWGSWIGGDRDGHPGVTASVTREAMRIQADHVLRGYEHVSERLIQTVSVTTDLAALDPQLAARLREEADTFPELARSLAERFPHQPYRQAFGFIRERIVRTRAHLTRSGGGPTDDRYTAPDELLADLRLMQRSLASHRAGRVAWGELQDFVWQLETFGFHLASLEVRQHSEVHRAAHEALRSGGDLQTTLSAGGVTGGEVLESFRAIWDIQAEFGEEACHRYVISFTRDAGDVHAVLDLAERSRAPDGAAGQPLPVDVVPLFESSDALAASGSILRALLDDPRYRSHLASRGDRQEVMLGYSDSNKELGFLGAGWALYRAQERLVAAARDASVELTLFHGRGGPIGRGGGPANRAIRAQAPGSIDGRLKLTEQGEVIAARYANPAIGHRELERLTHAVLLATARDSAVDSVDTSEWWARVVDELAELAADAYRRLVWDDPAFERFFHAATPIAEFAGLRIASRPVARSRGAGAATLPSLTDVRAIPWVFAWSQNRANLPGWYGLGSALAGYRERRRDDGLEQLRAAYRESPFLSSTLDNAEFVLATSDLAVGRRYASLAGDHDPAFARIWQAIEDEHRLSVSQLLEVTGRGRLLDESPRLQRSIELRNPYVDPLSELQVSLLRRSRSLPPEAAERAELERLVHLTISGVAAGLQHTG